MPRPFPVKHKKMYLLYTFWRMSMITLGFLIILLVVGKARMQKFHKSRKKIHEFH